MRDTVYQNTKVGLTLVSVGSMSYVPFSPWLTFTSMNCQGYFSFVCTNFFLSIICYLGNVQREGDHSDWDDVDQDSPSLGHCLRDCPRNWISLAIQRF